MPRQLRVSWLWDLVLLNAIVNCCGFNSEATVVVAKRLGAQHGKRKLEETSSTSPTTNCGDKHGGKAGPGILGVNLGKNKSSEDAASDYVQGVHTLSQYADYFVGNQCFISKFSWIANASRKKTIEGPREESNGAEIYLTYL
ncbi:hypothetical protein MLD38_023232 [Melastoma candidum]|uniref:Uncharacterized protein n=1 Tax=Melastoma candidum TaxID=119954 RepID=A0ACB9QLR7_9MYRT|nr:hypothetical protein MLD38_023232 [Melastoma candidum]